MKIELQALKAKIRGFEAEAGSIRKRINKSSGDKRCALWQKKRRLGEYTREHLIAYGLLREIPYERIERKSDDAQHPLNFDSILEIIHSHTPRWERSKWTKERLNQLFVRSEPTSKTELSDTTTQTSSRTTTKETFSPGSDKSSPSRKPSVFERVAGLLR